MTTTLADRFAAALAAFDDAVRFADLIVARAAALAYAAAWHEVNGATLRADEDALTRARADLAAEHERAVAVLRADSDDHNRRAAEWQAEVGKLRPALEQAERARAEAIDRLTATFAEGRAAGHAAERKAWQSATQSMTPDEFRAEVAAIRTVLGADSFEGVKDAARRSSSVAKEATARAETAEREVARLTGAGAARLTARDLRSISECLRGGNDDERMAEADRMDGIAAGMEATDDSLAHGRAASPPPDASDEEIARALYAATAVPGAYDDLPWSVIEPRQRAGWIAAVATVIRPRLDALRADVARLTAPGPSSKCPADFASYIRDFGTTEGPYRLGLAHGRAASMALTEADVDNAIAECRSWVPMDDDGSGENYKAVSSARAARELWGHLPAHGRAPTPPAGVTRWAGAPDVCPACGWSNTGLINYGKADAPQWMCHGCAVCALNKTAAPPPDASDEGDGDSEDDSTDTLIAIAEDATAAPVDRWLAAVERWYRVDDYGTEEAVRLLVAAGDAIVAEKNEAGARHVEHLAICQAEVDRLTTDLAAAEEACRLHERERDVAQAELARVKEARLNGILEPFEDIARELHNDAGDLHERGKGSDHAVAVAMNEAASKIKAAVQATAEAHAVVDTGATPPAALPQVEAFELPAVKWTRDEDNDTDPDDETSHTAWLPGDGIRSEYASTWFEAGAVGWSLLLDGTAPDEPTARARVEAAVAVLAGRAEVRR